MFRVDQGHGILIMPIRVNHFSKMKLHITESYPCSYLSNQLARSQIAVPDNATVDTHTYAKLIQAGFRRSGYFVYRPNCEHCTACVPVRIVVDQFVPNRTQRRAWKRHHDLRVNLHKLHFHPDHFRLYRRYQQKRHALSEMSCDTHDQYCEFLLQSSIDSVLVTFHDKNRLQMVSIIDQLPDGLSSVYTFLIRTYLERVSVLSVFCGKFTIAN